MQSDTTSNPPGAPARRMRWGRIVLAAVLSEASVVAVLLIAIGIYRLLGPPLSDAEMSSLGATIGYYVAPATGVVTTLLAVLWATRPLGDRFIAHGVLVGVGSLLLTVGFVFSALPEHRAMYVVALALRLAAGWAGGALARRRFAARVTRIPAQRTGVAA